MQEFKYLVIKSVSEVVLISFFSSEGRRAGYSTEEPQPAEGTAQSNSLPF